MVGVAPRRSDLLHAGVRLYLTYTAQDSSGFLIGEDDVAAEIHTQEISLDSFGRKRAAADEPPLRL